MVVVVVDPATGMDIAFSNRHMGASHQTLLDTKLIVGQRSPTQHHSSIHQFSLSYSEP
jgi:hypothetical protein